MNLKYLKATLADLNLLVETRIEVLRNANRLDDDVDMSNVKNTSREYYIKALNDNTHTAYLIFDRDKFVGSGGISYFTVMPTYHNPTGKKAYVMNMYVRSEYRRRGIARKTLDLLVQDAKERGIHSISLEATDMGRPLYEKYGFVSMQCEMELPKKLGLLERSNYDHSDNEYFRL